MTDTVVPILTVLCGSRVSKDGVSLKRRSVIEMKAMIFQEWEELETKLVFSPESDSGRLPG